MVIEIGVEDEKFPNENTAAAVDRIYDMVAGKVAEKASRIPGVASGN